VDALVNKVYKCKMNVQLKYFGIFLSLVYLAYGDGGTVVPIPYSVLNDINLRTDCHPDASM
jgi:hypothetical protein